MTARTVALVGYLVGAVAELLGFALVIWEFRDSRVALRAWKEANPKENPGGSYGQLPQLNSIMLGLLGTRWRRIAAVAAIAIGIVAGTIGNIASLPSA